MKKIDSVLKFLGIDFLKLILSPINTYNFLSDFITFKIKNKNKIFKFKLKNILPNYSKNNHELSHYFYQDIEIAKMILKKKPKNHLDIGSMLEGFVAHLLCSIQVHYVDVRRIKILNPDLKIINHDASNLKSIKDSEFESISCLHAMETFGLGRYGDKIDPEIELKFFNEILRILKKDGLFYLSVPIGDNIIYFNSHKTYEPKYIIQTLSALSLKKFFIIKNNGEIVKINDIETYKKNNSFDLGVFIFQK